jgi:hypothetical protein
MPAEEAMRFYLRLFGELPTRYIPGNPEAVRAWQRAGPQQPRAPQSDDERLQD